MATTTPTHVELLGILREENVLPGEVLDRLEARSGETNMPLGVILRKMGKLTMAQLIELSHLKNANPSIRLGELAILHGWCTSADVEAALAMQDRRSHLLDLVIADRACEPAALSRALVRYAKLLEGRVVSSGPRPL